MLNSGPGPLRRGRHSPVSKTTKAWEVTRNPRFQTGSSQVHDGDAMAARAGYVFREVASAMASTARRAVVKLCSNPLPER